MRTVDPKKHQARRTHIIESAVALFASKGFAETTTSDICRAAGISTGSLFHYFPSKQAVFYGIWELDRSEWDEVYAAAEADPDPWAALMAIVDKLAADAAEPIMAGLLVEVIAQAHRDPEFAAGLAENDRRQISDVASLIRRLRKAGLADPGLSDEEAARWVLTLTDGFLGRGYPEPQRDVDAAVDTAKVLIARVMRLAAATRLGGDGERA
jgi:AcrR family transcriptional regulator